MSGKACPSLMLCVLAIAGQALAAYAAALASDAACVPALLGCAAVYKDSGLLPEALASLEKALLALHISAATAASGGQDSSVPPAADAAAAAAGSLAAAGMPCDAASVRQALAVVLTDLGAASHGCCSGLIGCTQAPVQLPYWRLACISVSRILAATCSLTRLLAL